MQKRFGCGIAVVTEYILIWGNIKAHIFTNVFTSDDEKGMKANVKILEIMESGVKNVEEMQCVTEMAESAISKKFEDCYVFRLSNSGKITFFVNETEMNFENKNVQPKKAVKIEKTSEIQPVVFSYAR